MDYQSGSTTVCYQYGFVSRYETVKPDTTMAMIDQYLRDNFGSDLPANYSISFYDRRKTKVTKLDQEVLSGDGNPFRSNHSENEGSMNGVMHIVELFITSDASNLPNINHSQPSVESIDSDYTHAGLQQREQEVSVSPLDQNGSSSFDNILYETLFREDPEDDIRNIDNNTQAYQSNILDSGNDFTNGDSELDEFLTTDPLGMTLLVSEAMNDTTGPLITNGDAMPPLPGPPAPIIDVNINQAAAQQPARQYTHRSDRFYFSHDVKPAQKAVYLSDKHNQTDKTKLNGGIPYVQGIKKDRDKMKSVLPKVHIPAFIRKKTDAFIVVFVVSEEQKDGKRFWSKHRDKGFLPRGFTCETQSINPIELALYGNNSYKAGEFELGLRLVTWWKKKYQPELVHQLDEETTLRVHSAAHDPSSPRLLAVLRVGDRYYWNLFCLSGFICTPTKCAPTARPKKSAVSN